MIKVNFIKKDQDIIGFTSKGHAGYGEHGNDVICAAVSVLIINTVNAIESFTPDSFHIDENEKEGLITIKFNNKVSKETKLLLDTLILGLNGIESEYGTQYIQVSFKEV
ncbi:hypothetical protein EDC18_10455 [Natranaerovirga pectinivora]|uniref:Ribosomal processing cysteine protease Prp n=1 Tax=Natranaerovirga pectinivora TaxID=682400 RepID=A0A4R3MK20_9FIRM|nr:ribosomal-processing cysteine protease Prp [Natranaerovirga pectinivora]TCT14907.1 hypothetical protein EDC18_10455 [Natranaerovirga pectinivora]